VEVREESQPLPGLLLLLLLLEEGSVDGFEVDVDGVDIRIGR
jgi:hypothetical protein